MANVSDDLSLNLSLPLLSAKASASATNRVTGHNAVRELSGTSRNDDMWAWDRGNAVLKGGLGDDTYHIWRATDSVVETANGGTDTVIMVWRDYTLPDHVENLVLHNATNATGNGLSNMITGDAGAQVIDGKGGNDVLTGKGGADTFVIRQGEGSDVITDFKPGVDTVRLEGGSIFSFSDLHKASRQAGADTVISLGDDETLTLRNVNRSSLDADDFDFPMDPSGGGRTLTFSEDFDSLSASASGKNTIWKTTYGINKQDRTLASNKEAEYYSDSSVGENPFSVSDGVLTITAAPTDPDSNSLGLPYTSGLLTTAKSFSQLYGYFEARLSIPEGKGFWPAFWMLPAKGQWPPELDVVEVLGHDTDTAHVTVHSDIGGHTKKGFAIRTDDLSEGFHTFGVNWQADKIQWYIDGAKVAETKTPGDLHEPMYMLVNLAVGDSGSWPGKYQPHMPEAEMKVDYIRAWQTDETWG